MLRKLLAATATLTIPVGLLLTGGGAAAASAAPAGSTGPAACSSTAVIQITAFAFHPPQVTRGQSSSADLTAVNCTGVTQHTSETWYGRFIGPGPGIPPGCPVIDPFSRLIVFPPHAQVSTSTSYLVFSGCTATELAVTVKITGTTGVQLAQQTAYLVIR
jgi:hypothetical protein